MGKGAKFKKGQTVFSGRGKDEKAMVVARVIKNPLIPIHQYSFEAPNDGYACGEQSIRAKSDNPDLTLGECLLEDDTAVRINTIASAMRQPVNSDDEGFGDILKDTNVAFRPDLNMVKWLIKYADGRLIIDVGSGQGHLVRMIKMYKGKAMGIEPNFNLRVWLKWRMIRNLNNAIPDVNEILPREIEDCKSLISGMGADNVLLVFARPNDGDFVETGIRNMPKGMEALFITIPENIKKYNVLGEFVLKAEPIDHEGVSENDEVVLSIRK